METERGTNTKGNGRDLLMSRSLHLFLWWSYQTPNSCFMLHG